MRKRLGQLMRSHAFTTPPKRDIAKSSSLLGEGLTWRPDSEFSKQPMKIEVIKGSAMAVAKRELSDEEARNYRALTALGQRIGMYGFPILVLAWLFIGAPPDEFRIRPLHAVLFFAALIFTPLIHELVHAIAWPSKALHPDARIFVLLDGFRSGFAFRPGGTLTGIQFAWISILPFFLLTLIPLALQIAGTVDSFLLGIFAGLNFALSGVDLIQAFVVVRSAAFDEIA